METPKTVDFQTFRSFVGNNTGQISEQERTMADLFMDQAQKCIEELETAHEHEAAQEWHDAAHRLKSMAGYCGAERLREFCIAAEKAQNDTPENQKPLYDSIKSELDDVMHEFKSTYKNNNHNPGGRG